MSDERVEKVEKDLNEAKKKIVKDMKTFEGWIDGNVKGLEYAHKRSAPYFFPVDEEDLEDSRIDNRAIQLKRAEERIASLEERCDTLTGKVCELTASVDEADN